jgi:hypothetical protein
MDEGAQETTTTPAREGAPVTRSGPCPFPPRSSWIVSPDRLLAVSIPLPDFGPYQPSPSVAALPLLHTFLLHASSRGSARARSSPLGRHGRKGGRVAPHGGETQREADKGSAQLPLIRNKSRAVR